MSGVLMTLVAAGTRPMEVTVSPPSQGFIGSGANATTSPCMASVVGGYPPYSYSWAKDLGDAITAVDPTLAATAFRATGLTISEVRTAEFSCTVTDALGGVAVSPVISVFVGRT